MLVAVSGGRDSMVLMHAVANVVGPNACVVHIDHGLNPSSADWADQVMHAADALGLDHRTLRVDAAAPQGESREAAAREARYRALRSTIGEGGCLLTAHHRQDQAETFLLQLLRGSGPPGLAAMPGEVPFGPGFHLRPFLNLAGPELAAYAQAEGLSWIEDPSNLDETLARNFLRHQIMPRLTQLWPGADSAISRSAKLCGESARRDYDLAAMDLGDDLGSSTLPIETLRALAEDRARNAVRTWVARRGVRPPGQARLASFMNAALSAAGDRNPKVSWGQHELARYQGALHIFPKLPDPDPEAHWAWDGRSELDMGRPLGRVRLELGQGGLNPELLAGSLSLRLRQGGERIRPMGQQHHRALKSLLRELGCPPWLRGRVPLLYAGDELVAAGPWWIAAEHAVTTQGLNMKWHLNDSLQLPEITDEMAAIADPTERAPD